MTQLWINSALRSIIWLGVVVCLAYAQKPDGKSLLAVRLDSIGWLGGGICLVGLALHVWSNVSLTRGEYLELTGTNMLVTDGPFRYIRNPMYLAGIALVLGVSMLYHTWEPKDLILPLLLLLYFHICVVRVEEPALRRKFGTVYEKYCNTVSRWFPV